MTSDHQLFHVLVADDEPHIGRIIKMKLEQGPFRVTLAYDGREALEVLEHEIGHRFRPARPHDAAHERSRRARRDAADARWRDLPCIILTAAGQEQQHTSAMEMGANDFLTKPFSPKKLYARAAELVGHRRRRRAPTSRMSRWAVVLAGGVGSRFWPLSTPARPKQLAPLVSHEPLLVEAVDRLRPIVADRAVLILTNDVLVPAVAELLPTFRARISSPSRAPAERRRR